MTVVTRNFSGALSVPASVTILRAAMPSLALLLLTSCSSTTRPVEEPAETPIAAPSTPRPTTSSDPGRPVVLDPDRVAAPYGASTLVDLALTRRGGDYEVVSVWRSIRRGHEQERAIRVTRDQETRAMRWTRARAARLLPGASARFSGAEQTMAPLLTASASSVTEGMRAAVAGGDGATLLPFERVARESDGAWTAYDVANLHDDETPYVSGQVLLPDGRLLVLLDAWSGDRFSRHSGHRYSKAHHGLWVSEGDDWSRFSPFTPTLAPGSGFDVEPGTGSPYSVLGASDRGDGAVWFSAGGMVFASPDGRTFRRVPVAP